MAKINIDPMIARHQAVETALNAALSRLETAEAYIRIWQWSFVALGIVALTGWLI